MGNFKELPADFIGGKYEGGVKVILESEEDVRIFSDHWFPRYQDKIRFESAEEGNKGGGGCSAVLRKVREARDKHLTAFGIVDRDILLSDDKPDIFWETNDQAFHDTMPYGEEIHVLCRWELENYLLKPEAFSAELACRALRFPSHVVSAETFLTLEGDLIDVTALTTFLVTQRVEAPKPEFAQADSGNQLRDKISDHLRNKVPQGGGYNGLAGDVKRIAAFSEHEPMPEKRWDRLSRILDGKKALNRICGRLSQEYGVRGLGYWQEMRGCIANRIASGKLIDDELVQLVERFHEAMC